jgi:hypothetical protein
MGSLRPYQRQTIVGRQNAALSLHGSGTVCGQISLPAAGVGAQVEPGVAQLGPRVGHGEVSWLWWRL